MKAPYEKDMERLGRRRSSVAARACRRHGVKTLSVDEMRYRCSSTSTERARQSLCSCKSL
jgi:hypothetical protein